MEDLEAQREQLEQAYRNLEVELLTQRELLNSHKELLRQHHLSNRFLHININNITNDLSDEMSLNDMLALEIGSVRGLIVEVSKDQLELLQRLKYLQQQQEQGSLLKNVNNEDLRFQELSRVTLELEIELKQLEDQVSKAILDKDLVKSQCDYERKLAYQCNEKLLLALGTNEEKECFRGSLDLETIIGETCLTRSKLDQLNKRACRKSLSAQGLFSLSWPSSSWWSSSNNGLLNVSDLSFLLTSVKNVTQNKETKNVLQKTALALLEALFVTSKKIKLTQRTRNTLGHRFVMLNQICPQILKDLDEEDQIQRRNRQSSISDFAAVNFALPTTSGIAGNGIGESKLQL